MYFNNRKLALSIFWVILGITLMTLSAMNLLDSTLYSGMGGALAGIGILQIIRNIQYRTNSEYRERIDTEANDERNRFLRMKSWSWTGYIAILVEAIGMIIATILGMQTIQLVLCLSICLMTFTYWMSYMILCRKY